jgi:hypothetical protein
MKDIIESPDIVEAGNVVAMSVCKQHGVNIFHFMFQHLNPEIGATINNNIRTADGKHSRGSVSLIAGIVACANITVTGYDRNTG